MGLAYCYKNISASPSKLVNFCKVYYFSNNINCILVN